MRRFLEAVEGRAVFSDEPSFDQYWFHELAEAADLPSIKLGDAKALINAVASKRGLNFGEIAKPFPVRHRAEADASRLAMIFARATGIAVSG